MANQTAKVGFCQLQETITAEKRPMGNAEHITKEKAKSGVHLKEKRLSPARLFSTSLSSNIDKAKDDHGNGYYAED